MWSIGEGGFSMSFGIGAFPFGLFSSTFNLGDQRPRSGKLSREAIFFMSLSKFSIKKTLVSNARIHKR